MKGSFFVVLILASMLMAGRADHKEEDKEEEKAPATPFLPIQQAALPPPVVSRRRSGGYGKRSIPDGALEPADTDEAHQRNDNAAQQFLAFAPPGPGAGALPTRRRSGGYGK